MTFNRVIITITILLIISVLICLFSLETDSMKKTLLSTLKARINRWVRTAEDNTRKRIFKQEMSQLELKWNYLMNDLKLNIPIFKYIPLVHFKFLLYAGSIITACLVDLIVFFNLALLPFLIPIVFTLYICLLLSVTTRSRRAMLVDSIATENLLSANIEMGIIEDIKANETSIPLSIRREYKIFVENVEKLNYTIEDALQILDLDTACNSSEFLNCVNAYENYRQPGYENVFKEIVETNNTKILARDRMEGLMRQIRMEFLVAFLISYGTLIAELILIPAYRKFYFGNTIGQILLVIDLILFVFVYLRIAMIEAREL